MDKAGSRGSWITTVGDATKGCLEPRSRGAAPSWHCRRGPHLPGSGCTSALKIASRRCSGDNARCRHTGCHCAWPLPCPAKRALPARRERRNPHRIRRCGKGARAWGSGGGWWWCPQGPSNLASSMNRVSGVCARQATQS